LNNVLLIFAQSVPPLFTYSKRANWLRSKPAFAKHPAAAAKQAGCATSADAILEGACFLEISCLPKRAASPDVLERVFQKVSSLALWLD
jgi:hypothetical protein